MLSRMVSQNEMCCSTSTLTLGKKEAITSLCFYQFPYSVRHNLVHLVDDTKNEKSGELKRLVHQRLKYLGNDNYKGAGDLGIVLLSNCIFVPQQEACVLKKISMIMNYSQAQSNGFLIMKRQHRFLKSGRRDISLLALVVLADTMKADNPLDTLAIWTSQGLLSIQCTLIINWFLIGWIQVVLINFFSPVYVMLCPDFKDKITLQDTGISLSMYCIQIDPFNLHKPVDNGVIFWQQDCKDFEDAIQWSQYIRLAFFTDSIKKDTLHICYPACQMKFLLSFMDSVDEINILYFQVKFSLGCAQINTFYIFNIFNPVGYVLSNQDFKNLRRELNMKECEQQFGNEYNCISSLSQVGTWETEFERLIRKFTKIENRNRLLVEENQIIREELLAKDSLIEEMKGQLDFLKSDKLVSERKHLLEHEDMRRQLLKKDELMDEKTRQFKMLESETLSLESKCLILEEKLSKLQEECQKVKKDYEELILEHGRILVENDLKVNKVKETEQFQKVYIPKSSTSCVLNIKDNNSCNSGPIQSVLSDNRASLLPSSSSLSSLRKQSAGADGELLEVSEGQGNFQTKCEENGRYLNIENQSNVLTEQPRFSIEVVERDNEACISLMNQPSFSVPADVYNAYKLLLVTISDRLLYDDIIKLQEWANEKFSVQTSLKAYEIFMELDKKGVITALDLSQLSAFFESIVRHDLVHLIDELKNGDYGKLRKLVYQNKRSRKVNSNQVHSPRFRLPNSNTPGSPRRSAGNAQVDVSNAQVHVSKACVLGRLSATEDHNPTSVSRNHQDSGRFGSNFPSTSSSRIRSGLLMHGNSENVLDTSAVTNTRGNPENEHRIKATDAPLMTEPVRHKQTLQSRQPLSQCNHSHNAAGRCNGAHSHTNAHVHGATNGNNQDNWLCDHYKRRCLVKFECCDKYWACHRCHNNESTCGHRKLKSRDTKMIKCVECGKEQKFGQFCVSCNTQFADFFCGICKHLTGTDDHPYHCDKCGICRIHGDRSYHCDVCGICLDVQLRGNHKCRPNSAHDECCICLEDAFTGCQILPCSHKVHKDCATQMIRMGITRCPMCRESFAHKLERRPVKRKTTRRRHRTSPVNS